MRLKRIILCAAVAGGLLAPLALAENQAAPDTTDWPTMIARLQQDLQRQPGLARTRQQLAIAYNNYGVSLGNEGRWDTAVPPRTGRR